MSCRNFLSRMPAMLRRRSLRELPREQSGHAVVEVALIFPILLGLFLGVSEFSEAFTSIAGSRVPPTPPPTLCPGCSR